MFQATTGCRAGAETGNWACVLRGHGAGYSGGETVQCVELQADFDRMDARRRDQAAFCSNIRYSVFSLHISYL
jgi:hypothetical protein